MKKLAVIFDMDGVLVDTIPYNYRLWHDYLHSLGVELTKQGFQQILGMEFQDVVKVFESQFGINIDDAKLAAHLRKERDAYYQDHELLTSKALPRLLSSLYESGVPLAVATGSSRRTTELLLRKNQLTPFFSEIDM
jgi:beta-phosphoglucomutase